MDNLIFILEIDVTSDEDSSQSTLKNKVKETMNQLGATLKEEAVE